MKSFTADMKPTVRKVVVEYTVDGWLAMDERGDVTSYPTADRAVAAIRRADRKAGGFQVTIIDWLDAPAGWSPPS